MKTTPADERSPAYSGITFTGGKCDPIEKIVAHICTFASSLWLQHRFQNLIHQSRWYLKDTLSHLFLQVKGAT